MRLVIVMSLAFAVLIGGYLPRGTDFDRSIQSIVEPYSFSIVKWEFQTFSQGVGQPLSTQESLSQTNIDKVRQYFSFTQRLEKAPAEAESNLRAQKSTLRTEVEEILRREIRRTLSEQGIFNPWDSYTGMTNGFPPVNFRLESPPHLLVISPRNKIESLRETFLRQSLSISEMEAIEARTDELGLSSLVVGIGGLAGTYPPFVNDDGNPKSIIEGVAHEWVHQYLAFRPLGFFYVLDTLGIKRDYGIATINETVADMVGQEIGAIVYQKLYPEEERQSPQPLPTAFDFNREMREIRRTVDQYLAQGEIKQAESFMEEKRQFLSSKGYQIRKLNQAYFAFYGTYADSPASISPIGADLRKLRAQSTSLKEFLRSASALTSPDALKKALN
ncbi:MAG: hypothetical protein HYX81_05455 [Chloroflexi bacterium]|nr:hypothetical protein [Chloroflexota bacterium]